MSGLSCLRIIKRNVVHIARLLCNSVVHLVNCYCVPTLTYACEIWNLSSNDYYTVNVLWNNAFRRIFNCCWRERVHLSYRCIVDISQ